MGKRVVQGVSHKSGKKPRDSRYMRVCPVGYCRRKLSQHLSYKHPELSRTQRMKVARRLVQRRVMTVEPGRPTLHKVLGTDSQRHTNKKPH